MLYQILFGRERVTSVTVHERPDHALDRIARAEQLKFVKDGFDWSSFLFPPAFFLQNRLRAGLLSYVSVIGLLVISNFVFDLPANWFVICLLAVHAIIGWESDEMRRASLAAHGWSSIGHVTGSTLLDCERRFLDGWLTSVPLRLPQATSAAEPLSTTQNVSSSAGDRHRVTSGSQGILGSLLAPKSRH